LPAEVEFLLSDTVNMNHSIEPKRLSKIVLKGFPNNAPGPKFADSKS